MNVIADLKRQVIKNLKSMLAPHLWKSGYGHTEGKKWVALEIFAFPPIQATFEGKRGTMDGRNMRLQFWEHGAIVQGFYTDGVIDAVGGGCGCHSFDSFSVEDLLAMEVWMTKNFHKDVDKAKKHNKVAV